MHVSVTTLGADAGGVGRAADQIVGYLEGDQAAASQQPADAPSRAGSQGPDITPLADGLTQPSEAGGYYADSADAPGRWRGEGAGPEGFELGDHVDPEAFRRVLLGQHPHTEEQLVSALGSTGRKTASDRDSSVTVRSSGPADDALTPRQAAELIGVDQSHVRRLIRRTAEVREQQVAATAAGRPEPELPKQHLDATNDAAGRWSLERGEVERFIEDRKPAQVVLGYDITWSVPKSVSALHTQGDDRVRAEIDASIESAVTVGMSYLEAEGFHIRAGRDRERATDMTAASYRHNTNRSLEPQLHEHVVVANMAKNGRGETRAVDARGLYAHATPAGYLAAAQLRFEMRSRLRVEWAAVHKGLADIAGVDRSEIMAVSNRRQDVLSLSNELGFSTPQARQIAALATRPGKDHSVEATELQQRWKGLLADAGLTEAKAASLLDRGPVELWRPADTDALFAHLASHRGVTEQQSIFDRRDVIRAIAEQSVDRLPAAQIVDLADRWLTTEAVIPLAILDGARRETIGTGAAQVSLAPDEARFTTPQMIAIDERVVRSHGAGLATGHAQVPALTVEQTITSMKTASGIELGADQAAMVRSITTSGDQFQAVVGLAGAGKTTATHAAVASWEEAGYHVIGAAPFADAARNLEAETGLRSQTLEGLLTRIELAGDPRHVLGPNTVIVVDEASTIGNRQLDRLYRAAVETGAAVRTIGDPLQHQSVEAGGLWRHLTERFAEGTPWLGENRRQVGEEMTEVRQALSEYRQGLVASAMKRLESDNRIVTAESWDGLLDAMSADWYLDHRRHIDDGALVSKMIAERNSDRHTLNQRAQLWLREDGTLGPGVRIGGAQFHVGDRVVAQTKATDLVAEGAERRDHVINGSQGTVTALAGPRGAPDLVVDFDGLGTIRVSNEFIASEVGPGRGGGLSPAYAVTSFKAEGQTYDAGRNLAAPGAVDTEGMYVALTRGRHDQRTYSIAPADRLDERPELPVIVDERAAIDALIAGLARPRGADLATVADPNVATVASLATRPLSELRRDGNADHGRAADLVSSRIAAAAIADPHPIVVAALGSRPTHGFPRATWDTAVGEAAIYRAKWSEPKIATSGGVATPAAGSSPDQFGHYDRVTAAVAAADEQRLETEPLHRIFAQRDQVQITLDAIPLRDEIGPMAGVASAARELADARSAHRRAIARLATLRAGGRDRPRTDPNKVETARRRVGDTSQAVARAKTDLASAKQRVAAVQGDRQAHLTVAATAGAIERALERRIDTGVKRPRPTSSRRWGPVHTNSAPNANVGPRLRLASSATATTISN